MQLTFGLTEEQIYDTSFASFFYTISNSGYVPYFVKFSY